jgi:hypothetical protein
MANAERPAQTTVIDTRAYTNPIGSESGMNSFGCASSASAGLYGP